MRTSRNESAFPFRKINCTCLERGGRTSCCSLMSADEKQNKPISVKNVSSFFINNNHQQNRLSAAPPSPPLTDIILVDDGNLGPVEVDDQLAQGPTDDRRTRIEVDAELLQVRLQVQAGLDVRNVQCITQRLNVLAEERILRAEDGADAAGQLVTSCRDFITRSKQKRLR